MLEAVYRDSKHPYWLAAGCALANRKKHFFIHDGAAANFSHFNRDALDDIYHGKWIGKEGPVPSTSILLVFNSGSLKTYVLYRRIFASWVTFPTPCRSIWKGVPRVYACENNESSLKYFLCGSQLMTFATLSSQWFLNSSFSNNWKGMTDWDKFIIYILFQGNGRAQVSISGPVGIFPFIHIFIVLV